VTITRTGPFSFVVSRDAPLSKPYWLNAYRMWDGSVRFGRPWSSRRVAASMVGDEILWRSPGQLVEHSPPRDQLVYRVVLRCKEVAL
jgi:hypothetical protein